MLTENGGCIKQLACISSLESINVVAVAFLSKAELHFSWSDTASWCWQLLHCTKCLSSLGIAALCQNLVVTGLMSRSPFPSCPELEAEHWTPCAYQCGGLPFRKVSTCTNMEKRVSCSQIPSCTKLGYLGNDQSLCESNGLWGGPATWTAQSKFSDLLGTAAFFKGFSCLYFSDHC